MEDRVPSRSEIGLHAVSFLQADALGVAVPFVSNLLAQHGWRYDTIGVAIAAISLGVTLLQTPAGILADRVGRHDLFLALTAVVVGLCFGLLPVVPLIPAVVIPMMFLSGVGQAFFYPMRSAVAMDLSGHEGLSRMVGTNLSWNHLGNIASALGAMALAHRGGLDWPLFAVGGICLLAALASLLIVPGPHHHSETVLASPVAAAADPLPPPGSLLALIGQRRIVILGLAILLYSFANSPMMTTAALYINRLNGTATQVAALVLVAQVVMVPITYWTGRKCASWGSRWALLPAFLIIPIRGLLYPLTDDPWMVVAIQVLDGLAGGIFAVASIAVVADLTREIGLFNSLNALMGTVLGLGAVLSKVFVGVVLEQFGFAAGFVSMAIIAAVAALLFAQLLWEDKGPSARPRSSEESDRSAA
jgi:MFS family permease